MISILQETTRSGYANGTYHVDDSGALVGYKPPDGEYKEFAKPMTLFSKSQRTFKKVGVREDNISLKQAG